MNLALVIRKSSVIWAHHGVSHLCVPLYFKESSTETVLGSRPVQDPTSLKFSCSHNSINTPENCPAGTDQKLSNCEENMQGVCAQAAVPSLIFMFPLIIRLN